MRAIPNGCLSYLPADLHSILAGFLEIHLVLQAQAPDKAIWGIFLKSNPTLSSE